MQNSLDQLKKISSLIEFLNTYNHLLAQTTATNGFDGFIDSIVRVVKTRNDQDTVSLFETMNSFGKYILEKSGSSCSIELVESSTRLGGNMPIMSNAMASLGIKVNCIGALGYPNIHGVFKEISLNCQVFSFADPGTATAFEFEDGKIMFAQMGALNNIGWKEVRNAIGLHKLIDLYKKSDLISMVNWSEIIASGDIWEGILKEVIPVCCQERKKKTLFFDLSDCSKRTASDITQVLNLLNQYAKYTRVVLGLNRNEANIIYRILSDNKIFEDDPTLMAKCIYDNLDIDTVLLHHSSEAISFDQHGAHTSPSFFISNPKISTGAGDHFNAGFCAAQLMQADMDSSLLLANAVAGYYVKNGESPQIPELIDFLKQYVNLDAATN